MKKYKVTIEKLEPANDPEYSEFQVLYEQRFDDISIQELVAYLNTSDVAESI